MSTVLYLANQTMVGAAVGWTCYNSPVAGVALTACAVLSGKVMQKTFEQLPQRVINRFEKNNDYRNSFFQVVGRLVSSLVLGPAVLQKLGCSPMPVANRFLLLGGVFSVGNISYHAENFLDSDLYVQLRTAAWTISGTVAAGAAFSILTPPMCALVGAIMSAVGALIAHYCPERVAFPVAAASCALIGSLGCRAILGLPLSAGVTLAAGAIALVSAQAFIIPWLSEKIETALQSKEAALFAFGVGGAVAAGAAFSTLSVSMCALAGAIITGVGVGCAMFGASRNFEERGLYLLGFGGPAIVGPLACRALLAIPLSSGALLVAGAVSGVCAQIFAIPKIQEIFSRAPRLS